MTHRTVIAAATLLAALCCAAPAGAATITATTTADDATPSDGSVSLREAITAINAGSNLGDPDIAAQSPGTFGTGDTINFNIAGSGVHTINVGSDPSASGIALPKIARTLTMNGLSQPATEPIRIALDGTSAGSSSIGLEASAPVDIQGLDIEHFGGPGIKLVFAFLFGGSSGSHIGGVYVGTNPAGTAAAGNGAGILVVTDSNTIEGSVVSGNGSQGGVVLTGDDNTLRGSRIGTNAAGTAQVGNGVNTFGGAVALGGDRNTVGGTAASLRNVISGNAGSGIVASGRHSLVQGNFIGTDLTGLHPIPNLDAGVRLDAGGNQTISGTPGAPQKIWFNGGFAIHEAGSGDRFSVNSITGNVGGISVGGSPATGSLSLRAADRRTMTVKFANATPGGLMSAEVFDNSKRPQCPGQGQVFLGGGTVGVPASGSGKVTLLLDKALPVGDGVTGTLTDTEKGTSPFICLKGGVVLPSNAFKIVKAAGDAKGNVVLTLSAPGAGSFKAKATFAGKAAKLRRAAKAKHTDFGKASAVAHGPGKLTITIHPGSAARRALSAGRKLTVTVAVKFVPTGGVGRTITRALKVKGKP